jgi:hypothetical protein
VKAFELLDGRVIDTSVDHVRERATAGFLN